MNLMEVVDLLKAEVLTGSKISEIEISDACGADLMSDILADTKYNALLLTGLVHSQILQTAAISDFAAIVFVRGKMPSRELIELARGQNLPLLRTQYPLFQACGILYAAGLTGGKKPFNSSKGSGDGKAQKPLKLSYDIKGNDFNLAGKATEQAKKVLKQLGVDSNIVRKVSIAAYEAEMNIVIHAFSGSLTFGISPAHIEVIAQDKGPGIVDVDIAQNEGYSTASDKIRELGFGAGMGIPNMKRFSDKFQIESVVGEGTKVVMLINL